MKGTKLCDRNLERGDGSKVSLLHEDAAVKGNLCPDSQFAATAFMGVDGIAPERRHVPKTSAALRYGAAHFAMKKKGR